MEVITNVYLKSAVALRLRSVNSTQAQALYDTLVTAMKSSAFYVSDTIAIRGADISAISVGGNID